MKPDPSQIKEIFAYWQKVMEHPRARLTADRKTAVRRRLAEGYTVADIKQAVDGCKASPFHQGENTTGAVYDDLTLICRSGSKLEQFIGYLSRRRVRPNDPGRPSANTAKEKYTPPCQTCGGIGMVDSHANNPGFVPGRKFTNCPDCS